MCNRLVVLKLWATAQYLAAEVYVPGGSLTPEIYILYRAFSTIRKYSKVFILIQNATGKYLDNTLKLQKSPWQSKDQ